MALTPTHLRLETPDGRAQEYRIRDGEIETRQPYHDDRTEDNREWHRLTPEQLTDHVNRSTVVAQWLERRLGWQRLLRVCVGNQYLYCVESPKNTADRRAA